MPEFGHQRLHSPRVQAIASPPEGKRLNLVLLTVDPSFRFGGVTTAIRFFESLAKHFDFLRVISVRPSAEPDLSLWAGWESDQGTVSRRSLLLVPDVSTPVPIYEGDHFIATAWMTDIFVRNTVQRQNRLFSGSNRRHIYFLQEYDPGFYSWSLDRDLARSTYEDTDGKIAVFNMKRFADYFHSRSIAFEEQYIFEPKLHPQLQSLKPQLSSTPKQRLIVAYARPNLPRNAFGLVVDSLTTWAKTFEDAHRWTVLSWGDRHDDMKLGSDITLRSLGHLAMPEYASYLARCWIGVSFMFLPHPGYTRLEMADFGSWVITNRMKGNDLSDMAPSILAVDKPSADSVAAKINWCCNQYSEGKTSVLPERPRMFSDAESEFPPMQELTASWLGHVHSPPHPTSR